MSKVQSIIEEIKGLSLLEASELVKGLEETFGVSAAAANVAVAGAAPAAGGAAAAAPAEEKTEFNVILTAVGGNKIGVIKAVREITSLGLKEAKDLVEGAPKAVKESSKSDFELRTSKFPNADSRVKSAHGPAYSLLGAINKNGGNQNE